MRHAVAVVLVGVAALVLWACASLAHGLTAMYGPGTVSADAFGVLLLTLVPGSVALLCLLGARDPVGPPRPPTWVLAIGVYAVFAASVWGAAAYGGRAHERDVEARATACSPQDAALLAAVDAPGVRSEVMGDEDGGCSVVVHGVPDADSATQDVVAALEQDGWQRAPTDGGEQVLRRAGEVLRLSASSDGKVTDVRLTLEPST